MLLSGCGAKEPSGRQAVAGTVSLHGDPLEQGMMQLFRRALARREAPMPSYFGLGMIRQCSHPFLKSGLIEP